ncbi:MAG TPA: glycosyltransferase [Pyrinomonadaceae bacterium]|nr:glycosyltransferase [Pyrinomonadaceae bacterium]
MVVIPTRNRSAIATNAINSVLDQPVEHMQVMVSDNSTSESEREALAAFCSTRDDNRLRYVRPPEPLSMTAHWQWAIEQALEFYQASHFTYLTDRMMFRTGALKEALAAVSLYPEKIVSYNMDRIVDHVRPIRVEQYPGTEKLLEIQTVDLSRLVSQSVFHAALPRMLNCIVPREVFVQMQARFGNVFSSIAPDFHFCCRCMEMEETVLFYDRSFLFHYALDRSHGATVTRGEINPDAADFTANLPVDNSIRNFATPIPQLITAVNAIFQEYCLFKQETGSPRFFEIDIGKYLQANADEIGEFTNPDLRAKTLALLVEKGYQAGAVKDDSKRVEITFQQRLRGKLKRMATSSGTTETWLFAARHFGIEPPGENSFEFATLDEAVDYAKNVSRGNVSRNESQPRLIPTRELPTTVNGAHGSETQFANLRQALVSVVPLSFRRVLHERRNQVRLATLLRTKSHFRASRKAAGSSHVPEGINLIGYIRADMGLGVAARGMASAFEAAGIPFNVINLEHGNYSSHTDCSWSHKEVSTSRYDVTVVCVNPDNSFYLRTQVSSEILGNRYVIANWYWELPEVPDHWLKEFEYVDEVWAPSNFIREAIAKKAAVPIVRVPTVVNVKQRQRFSRTQLGLPEHRFLFLAMFDTRSILERKNPLGVLRAFKSAFRAVDTSVGLVMKFNNANYDQPLMRALQAELAGWENIFVVDRLLTRDELTSLIDACDCYVSLHRSEGFGLGPAEAMRLGKPAILTNWSGSTDYVTHDNCVPIDYKLVELDRDYGPYKAGQQWADPDLEQAAHWMKRIAAEPELAREIGLRGQQTINAEFSPKAVGRIIQARLDEIRSGEY